jgi:hypothetical protein
MLARQDYFLKKRIAINFQILRVILAHIYQQWLDINRKYETL